MDWRTWFISCWIQENTWSDENVLCIWYFMRSTITECVPQDARKRVPRRHRTVMHSANSNLNAHETSKVSLECESLIHIWLGAVAGPKEVSIFFTFHMGSWVSSFKPWKFRHEHFSGLRLKQFRGKIMKSHRHLWLITVHWMDIFCVHVQSRIPILIVSIHIKS